MATISSVGTAVKLSGNVAANDPGSTPLPATRPAGDVLILYTSVLRTITATCATPSGWTLLAGPITSSGTTGRAYIFGLPVTGSETAPTVAWTGLTTGTTGTP